MSKFEIPKVYELIITYLDSEDQTCRENMEHQTMEECLQEIKHFRVNYGCEIMKYEINVQRVLF